MCEPVSNDNEAIALSREQHAELMREVRNLVSVSNEMRQTTIAMKESTEGALTAMKQSIDAGNKGMVSGVKLLASVLITVPFFILSTWLLHAGTISQWVWLPLNVSLLIPLMGKDIQELLPLIGRGRFDRDPYRDP